MVVLLPYPEGAVSWDGMIIKVEPQLRLSEKATNFKELKRGNKPGINVSYYLMPPVLFCGFWVRVRSFV